MTIATIIHAGNPFRPADRNVFLGSGKIRDLAPKTDLPFVCVVAGQYVLRADWDREVQPGEVIAFVTVPQGGGGGGSQLLQTVAMIAIAIYAGPIATQLTGLTEGIGFAATKLGVALVGSALISSLTPKPSLPSNLQQAAIAAPSPTYSLQAQGNYARLEQSIPVRYGRSQFFPDIGAPPYSTFQNEDQFLHEVFVIGQGEYAVEAIKIEDTPIGNFSEVVYELVNPGASVTLFETNIVSSPEVSGQELLEPAGSVTQWSVAVVAIASGSQCDQISVDVACPRGLFYAQDDGTLIDSTVEWTVQARTIDNFGNATGSWTTIGTETLTENVTNALRRSYDYTVTAGRYEVRVGRTNAKDTSSRAGNDLNWIGLRARLTTAAINSTTCTLLAVKIRVTNNIAGNSARRVNVLATRKLPTWTPTGGWSANTSTRSIAWAFADIVRNTVYGAGKADARLALQDLYDLDQIFLTRGDYFDASFDNSLVIWEALQKVAGAGRAAAVMNWGIVTMVRDSQQTVPVALFSNRNIVKGSFQMTYLVETDESPDGIVAEYFDNQIWRPLRVTGMPSGGPSEPTKPQKVQFFGITGALHAQREALYMAEDNRRRRKPFSFDTEMEGLILRFGDMFGICHDLADWGQSGEVLAVELLSDDLTRLTVSELPVWTAATAHYISLVRKNGSVSGPYVATAGPDPYQIDIENQTIDFDINAGIDYERTRYCFGEVSYQAAKVTGIRPASKTRVTVYAVNEDDRVHDADAAFFADGSGSAPEVDSTTFYINETTTNVSLFTLAGSPAVAGSYTFVVNAGVVVGGNGADALVTGVFPAGSTISLINNGTVVGYGGDGGDGDPWIFPYGPAALPTSGGNAIRVDYDISITNNGTIGGGGGGGVGGSFVGPGGGGNACGGGGGGGAGYVPGAGGLYLGGSDFIIGTHGTPGSVGTLTTGGSGGTYMTYTDLDAGTTGFGEAGFAGGNLGANGEGGSDAGAAGLALYSNTGTHTVTLTGNAVIGSTSGVTVV